MDWKIQSNFKLISFYFLGHTDDPLNEFGEKQAQAVGKALQNVTFHQAYSSDLKRTFKTCQLILNENQASEISAEDITQDERIKEQYFGEFENAKINDFIMAWILEAIKATMCCRSIYLAGHKQKSK